MSQVRAHPTTSDCSSLGYSGSACFCRLPECWEMLYLRQGIEMPPCASGCRRTPQTQPCGLIRQAHRENAMAPLGLEGGDRMCQSHQETTRSQDRGLEQVLPHSSRKGPVRLTPRSWTPLLQNCETILLSFRPLCLWHFATAALAK